MDPSAPRVRRCATVRRSACSARCRNAGGSPGTSRGGFIAAAPGVVEVGDGGTTLLPVPYAACPWMFAHRPVCAACLAFALTAALSAHRPDTAADLGPVGRVAAAVLGADRHRCSIPRCRRWLTRARWRSRGLLRGQGGTSQASNTAWSMPDMNTVPCAGELVMCSPSYQNVISSPRPLVSTRTGDARDVGGGGLRCQALDLGVERSDRYIGRLGRCATVSRWQLQEHVGMAGLVSGHQQARSWPRSSARISSLLRVAGEGEPRSRSGDQAFGRSSRRRESVDGFSRP